jgi:hypothetical protein
MNNLRIGSQVDHNPDLYAFRRTYPDGLSVEPEGSWFGVLFYAGIIALVFIIAGLYLGLPLS